MSKRKLERAAAYEETMVLVFSTQTFGIPSLDRTHLLYTMTIEADSGRDGIPFR